MNPSPQVRLDSMMKALTDVILPAIPAVSELAVEQAQLLLGHLAILRSQIDFLGEFEDTELRAARTLANALCAVAEGSRCTEAAAADLARLGANGTLDETLMALESLILAAAEDGTPEFKAQLRRLVIRHGRIMADLNRSAFAGTQFEVAPDSLPSLPEALATASAAMATIA